MDRAPSISESLTVIIDDSTFQKNITTHSLYILEKTTFSDKRSLILKGVKVRKRKRLRGKVRGRVSKRKNNKKESQSQRERDIEKRKKNKRKIKRKRMRNRE